MYKPPNQALKRTSTAALRAAVCWPLSSFSLGRVLHRGNAHLKPMNWSVA